MNQLSRTEDRESTPFSFAERIAGDPLATASSSWRACNWPETIRGAIRCYWQRALRQAAAAECGAAGRLALGTLALVGFS